MKKKPSLTLENLTTILIMIVGLAIAIPLIYLVWQQYFQDNKNIEDFAKPGDQINWDKEINNKEIHPIE